MLFSLPCSFPPTITSFKFNSTPWLHHPVRPLSSPLIYHILLSCIHLSVSRSFQTSSTPLQPDFHSLLWKEWLFWLFCIPRHFFPFLCKRARPKYFGFPWLSGLEWVMTDNDSTGSHPLWTSTHGKLHISGVLLCKVDSDVHAHVCCLRKYFLCSVSLEKNVPFNSKTYFLNLSDVQ